MFTELLSSYVVLIVHMITSIMDVACSFLKIFIETKPCSVFRTMLSAKREYIKESCDGTCFQEVNR